MFRWLLDERNVMVVIGINAVILFLLGFPQLPPRLAQTLDVLDHAITLLFAIEAIVKVRALGFREYWSSGWNRLDLFLLALALPSLVASLLVHSGSGMEFLFALRIGRAFKFFRTLRVVPDMRQLVEGIARALRTSIALVLGFVIGLFIISLLSTRLFGDVAPEHFGDPLVSLYSTFKIFTVEGWFEVPDAVAERLDGPAAQLTRLFFSAVLLVCGIFGLSLLNSVFVDAMVADNNDALERKVNALHDELREIRKILLAQGRDSAPPSD